MNADIQRYSSRVVTVAQPDASLSVNTEVLAINGSFVAIAVGATVLSGSLAYLCFRVERLVKAIKDD
ncbi:MAG: hypothetical protein AAGF93_04055 [Cyanobacteria bacterium P01_H01_bin.105]